MSYRYSTYEFISFTFQTITLILFCFSNSYSISYGTKIHIIFFLGSLSYFQDKTVQDLNQAIIFLLQWVSKNKYVYKSTDRNKDTIKMETTISKFRNTTC
ncbi:hypothetical protein CIPAW_09G045800 [Carya illinoinensis]|uniref:Uncharacterized protein n=1 Tax=Carya illinoinensis TaxID=32201 RepID=A0A8T1PAF8_CARIL|nr:hypothetical protein CIPAW_09G045800 [Carya illinoinensis]